jgi:hypothetical protein
VTIDPRQTPVRVYFWSKAESNLSNLEAAKTNGGLLDRSGDSYQVDPGTRKLQVVSQEKWGERTNDLVQLSNRLIMRDAR